MDYTVPKELTSLLKELGFKEVKANYPLYEKVIRGEYKVHVSLLSDSTTVRVSVLEEWEDEIDSIELFETQGYTAIRLFIGIIS